MATIEGTKTNYRILSADKDSGIFTALVLFNLSGTYAQADNAKISDVGAWLASSQRHGRTITLQTATLGQDASKASAPGTIMALSTIAVSTDDITFQVTDGDYTTELADGAVPAQERPFGVLVTYTEA